MPFSVLRLNLQSSHLEPLAQSPNNLTGRNKTHATRRYISPVPAFLRLPRGKQTTHRGAVGGKQQ
jgi:hypothetical protein